jgi:hypothetical protein
MGSLIDCHTEMHLSCLIQQRELVATVVAIFYFFVRTIISMIYCVLMWSSNPATLLLDLLAETAVIIIS